MQESDLYEPIQKALKEKFQRIGQCHLEITEKGIPEELKDFLSDDSVYIFEFERKRPDLMGYVIPYGTSKAKPKKPKLIVVEVKKDFLIIENIYQIKMYAEMISADFAFLISPKGFNRARINFLKDKPLLNFNVKRNQKYTFRKDIYLMRFLEDNSLELDDRLDQQNPFRRDLWKFLTKKFSKKPSKEGGYGE